MNAVAMMNPVWVKNCCSNSSSSDNTLFLVSGLGYKRSQMSEVSSVETTSIIDDLLEMEAQVHDQLQAGMKGNTIQWGKDC